MADFIKHFDEHFAPKLARREDTFRSVFNMALEKGVHSIVEVGTMRLADNWGGDGQSTLIWEAFAKEVNGEVITIDMDKEAIDFASSSTDTRYTKCICGDGVATLNELICPIDLLYLDSSDLDASNSHPAAMTCLMEFTAALPKLHPNSIVFIDDTFMLCNTIIGKGEYVAEFMTRIGLSPFTYGYQAAWIMK